MTDAAGAVDVAEFRTQARDFLANNVVRRPPAEHEVALGAGTEEDDLARVARNRESQRAFADAGFAGICIPTEYGGRGLTPAHQQVFNQELEGYEYAADIQAPTFTPCAAVLLEFGTEEQKLAHLPAMIRGQEIWMQMLSEPGGGSDLAGLTTTAVRDGAGWRVNGSKLWTTGAWFADWALCLVRTDWDVPKHRGLTAFMLPIHQEGVTIHRIETLDGAEEFCQEYLSDVFVPDTDRVGEVNDGWTVARRWLYHEKMWSGGSPYVTRAVQGGSSVKGAGAARRIASLAESLGRSGDSYVDQLVGEARTLEMVLSHLTERITVDTAQGRRGSHDAAISRLFRGSTAERHASIAYEIAGIHAVAWSDEQGREAGVGFLMRQASSIGGGTLEMSRNIISERVLGMPREPSHDPALPFRAIRRGPRA